MRGKWTKSRLARLDIYCGCMDASVAASFAIARLPSSFEFGCVVIWEDRGGATVVLRPSHQVFTRWLDLLVLSSWCCEVRNNNEPPVNSGGPQQRRDLR